MPAAAGARVRSWQLAALLPTAQRPPCPRARPSATQCRAQEQARAQGARPHPRRLCHPAGHLQGPHLGGAGGAPPERPAVPPVSPLLHVFSKQWVLESECGSDADACSSEPFLLHGWLSSQSRSPLHMFKRIGNAQSLETPAGHSCCASPRVLCRGTPVAQDGSATLAECEVFPGDEVKVVSSGGGLPALPRGGSAIGRWCVG